MTKTFTATASTVDEAKKIALEELNVSENRAQIEVVNQGGMFDKAEVKVTIEDNALEMITEFVNGIIEKMGLVLNADISEENNVITVTLKGQDSERAIGRKGQVLESLNCIFLSYLNQYGYDYKKITIDCDGYWAKREKTLTNLALKYADKSYAMGREVEFEPMSSYDRRTIHAALSDSLLVETESEGEEPNRYVVLKPKTDIIGSRYKVRNQDDRHGNKDNKHRRMSNKTRQRSEEPTSESFVGTYTDLDVIAPVQKANGAPKFKSFGAKRF